LCPELFDTRFPILSVEIDGVNVSRLERFLVDASPIHAIAMRVAPRRVKGRDPTRLAEIMLRDMGVKGIQSEIRDVAFCQCEVGVGNVKLEERPSGAHAAIAVEESEVFVFMGELEGESAAVARAGMCRKRHF